MANELKRVYGSAKTLEASGAAINSGAIGAADDSDYTSTDTADYPHAVFVLYTAFGSAPTAYKTISLIIEPQQIDSTEDVRPASASYIHPVYGVFVVDNTASATRYYCEVFNIPKEGHCELYNGTDQQMSTGWSLKMTPLSLAPS